MTQLIPLDKRSKKARQGIPREQRGSWHGSTLSPGPYRAGRFMTEQELNKRITEILESTKNEPGCGRRSGRQYRRTQCVRHSDHLLFLIQHSRYAPNMGYIMGDYERLRTLLHSGLHIQYMKSSDRQQYLKLEDPIRKVRKYFGLSKKGQPVSQSVRILVDALLNLR